MTTDAQLIQAFREGQNASHADAYLSDNPYDYESDLWEAWVVGYDDEDGPPRYVARKEPE